MRRVTKALKTASADKIAAAAAHREAVAVSMQTLCCCTHLFIPTSFFILRIPANEF